MSILIDTLTWRQFKDEVDRQLAEQGISEDKILFYIDTGNYPSLNGLEVRYSDDDGLVI